MPSTSTTPTVPLWEKLLDPKTLKRGWHLSRADMRNDFVEDLLAVDVFAQNLDGNIEDIKNGLLTNSYEPKFLLQIEVPKSTLGVRPGSLPAIEDRIILYSILYLLAPKIDQKLPDSVYSYRLKDSIETGKDIFKESEVIDVPFLKRTTIAMKIDPFEAWYEVWPEFERKTREAFKTHGYSYLVISDISAYFENIQLLILRDHLLEHFPTDSTTINLLFGFLESWATKTNSGRPHLRGIPQGTTIGSILGNLFLLPLDLLFQNLKRHLDIQYYRYMDDIRIFAKEEKIARRALFEMDKCLRSLHLNIQTAKTKILNEKFSEISHFFVDPRIDALSKLIEDIDSDLRKGGPSAAKKTAYLRAINNIAGEKPFPKWEQKIKGSKKPFSGLTLRAFRRWITANARLGSSKYIPKLLKEIIRNPDYRLTRRIVFAAKEHPSKKMIGKEILKFINSDFNIFPHQEAELIRAARYLSDIPAEMIDLCKQKLLNVREHYYPRMQSAYLLSRIEVPFPFLQSLLTAFHIEPNSYVKRAMTTVLVQWRGKGNEEFLTSLIMHPNRHVHDVGKLFQRVKQDEKFAIAKIGFIFEKDQEVRLCDNMHHVFLMSQSPLRTTASRLRKELASTKDTHPIISLRSILNNIFARCVAGQP